MFNTIIIDKKENSAALISSYLNNFEGVSVCACFEDFSTLLNSNFDLNQVDLIIFDVDSHSAKKCIDEINKIKNKYPDVQFLAMSYEINSELVSKILKEDVREFLLKPVIPNILEGAIQKIKKAKNNTQTINANIISVFSNKSGSGKTSLAVNIAYEMANITKEKVCLLDLSFNSEDIATFLNVKTNNTPDKVLSEIENKNEKTMFSLMNNYQGSNLYVFSFQDEFNLGAKFNSQSVLKIINSLKNIFRYIIIDASSNVDETTASILHACDLVLLIGMLNLASIRNCQKCYDLFDNIELNRNKVKLIVNRFIENSEITTKDVQEAVGSDVFFKIPNNYLTLIDAINLGRTVIETNPQSNIAKAYKNLAQELCNINFVTREEGQNKAVYNHGIYNLLRRMGEN